MARDTGYLGTRPHARDGLAYTAARVPLSARGARLDNTRDDPATRSSDAPPLPAATGQATRVPARLSVRVAVIGAGLQGVATAYFLARDGHDVLVLDRAGEVARGTSHANAGMLTPSMADPWNDPGVLWKILRNLGHEDSALLLRPHALPAYGAWGLRFLANARPARFADNMRRNLRLADYSMQVLRALRDELGLAYDQLANGTLKVFREPRALERSAARCMQLAALGVAVQPLSATEAVALEPALAPIGDSIVGAIHCPGDESGDARRFTEGLAGHARRRGVEFGFDTPVIDFETSGSRVVEVTTARGAVRADAVVVAAASWTAPLLRHLGIALPVRPVKGYSVTLDMGAWQPRPRMPVLDDSLHAAATPLGTQLRVAGTAEFAGYDTQPTPARVDNLFRLTLRMFPGFAPHLHRDRASPWAGLRPMSADGVPLIGPLKLGNLYLNTGHGHLGWTLACGSARLLADLVSGNAPAIDPLPYSATRFSAG